jgi:hypothetical protein
MVDITPESVARMLDGVTEGPWLTRNLENFGHNVVHYIGGDKFNIRRVTKAHEEQDARFIAWAREAVPAMAARIAELTAERDALAKIIDPDETDPALMAAVVIERFEALARAMTAEARVAELETAQGAAGVLLASAIDAPRPGVTAMFNGLPVPQLRSYADLDAIIHKWLASLATPTTGATP